MSFESLPESEWEPTTPGMLVFVQGSRVTFNHKVPHKLPDDELLQLAQLNEKPPSNLISEIARRGLQSKFRDLWQRGLIGS